jgi:hypothetical protein
MAGEEQPSPTPGQRFSNEAGWVALAVGVVLGTAGATEVIGALFESPTFDAAGAVLFWQVFWVTLPFTIGAVVFSALLFADVIKSGIHLLWAGALCLVGGAMIGTAIGSAGNVDLDAAALQVHGGGPTGLASAIWWFLTAYYQLYGWAYFVSAMLLGLLFGKWAAWLYRERVAT